MRDGWGQLVELKSFHSRHVTGEVCVLGRLFYELSRKHERGKWIMAGIPQRWLL